MVKQQLLLGFAQLGALEGHQGQQSTPQHAHEDRQGEIGGILDGLYWFTGHKLLYWVFVSYGLWILAV